MSNSDSLHRYLAMLQDIIRDTTATRAQQEQVMQDIRDADEYTGLRRHSYGVRITTEERDYLVGRYGSPSRGLRALMIKEMRDRAG